MAILSREARRPILTATRARQGRWRQHVFWVLLFGTLLAALGLFAAWTWKAPDLAGSEQTTAQRAATAATFDTPAPTSPTPAAP